MTGTRASEPLFYQPATNVSGSGQQMSWGAVETFKPLHRHTPYFLFVETPVGYKPRHRATPPWEDRPRTQSLYDFIGGA